MACHLLANLLPPVDKQAAVMPPVAWIWRIGLDPPTPPIGGPRTATIQERTSCLGTVAARVRGGTRAAARAEGGGGQRPPRRRRTLGRPADPWRRARGGPRPDARPRSADRQEQAYIRGLLAGGPAAASGGRGLALIGLAVVALWLASGFYRVQPDEQGVVLRFGAFNRIDAARPQLAVPWPIERVLPPAVTRINRTEIGYRSGAARGGHRGDPGGRDVPDESLMLTGDENIIDINFAVFWRITTPSPSCSTPRDPRRSGEGGGGELDARGDRPHADPAGADPVARADRDRRAATRRSRSSTATTPGVEMTQVQLQKVDPPDAVIESFRDVQRANTDAERMRNEAEAYRNDIVPRARGDAARIIAEGQGANRPRIAQATGQTQRFLSVFARLPGGQGRDAAAHVPRDDAGHPDPVADTGGGRQAEGPGAVPAAQSAAPCPAAAEPALHRRTPGHRQVSRERRDEPRR